ncbi:hypothetical protein [Streptomyces violascens]|nr:hypothetical protein [Streptomyces violascens]GGT85704.1 hypothetical protein GCM10010289_01730 [Streptomyces violascens]
MPGLPDAQALFDNTEILHTQSNPWAADRSWAVRTDYDVWSTKSRPPPAR